MNPSNQQILKQAIIETIQNQIQNNDPPETKETLDRLLAEGFPEEEAMKLIGCVVTTEINEVLRSQLPFNRERFVNTLQRLPVLPWD